jgi:NAD(P)-dependent dehydrogenase (short-subunit alcohol dehydrogenase family)
MRRFLTSLTSPRRSHSSCKFGTFPLRFVPQLSLKPQVNGYHNFTMATTFKPSKILIFGATGQIGAYITEALLSADPPFPHVAAFTSEATARDKAALLSRWRSRGLSVITGDVTDKAQVQAAYATGVDTVVSAVGRGVLLHQTELARWADEQEGGSVRWFLPSEYGTDIEYGPESAKERPHQAKLAVRKFLREEVRRVRSTFVVTGPYADMFFTLAPGLVEAGGFEVGKRRAVLLEDGNGKVGLTTRPEYVLITHTSSPISRFRENRIHCLVSREI